jgi:hypothetical protein
MTKRLDRLEVALTKRQEPHHRLDQVRGLHPLRDRKFWVDDRFHLRRLAALPDQRQPRIGGEIELCRLLDFKAGHGQLGEEG